MTSRTSANPTDLDSVDRIKGSYTAKHVDDLHFDRGPQKLKEQESITHSTVVPKRGTTTSVNQELLSSLHCPKCKTVFRKPLQLNCGHRLRQNCVDSFDGDEIGCSECGEFCPKKQTMLDRGVYVDNQNAFIMCSSCPWKGIYKDYEGHCRDAHERTHCHLCRALIEPEMKSNQHYMGMGHQKCITSAVLRISEKESSQPTSSGVESKLNADSTTTDPKCHNYIGAATEMISLMSEGVQSLEQETHKIRHGNLSMQQQLEKAEHECSLLKISIEEQDTYMKGQKLGLEIFHEFVACLRDDVEDHQKTTYDATLIWVIKDFKKKLADSRSGRQTSIYSQPFYSSPTGYKMRARLYPNGDGNVRGSYMSLFFVLMRGPHDSILKFPFSQKVTFCLFDQTDAQKHHVDSFRPDINSNSFQRPTSEMNIASGIPKFVPLSVVEQTDSPYVRNDTMFIKIMVDFGDMPKSIMPYLLSLDPGLPAHVQEVLCREELERRSKEETKQNRSQTIEVK